MLRFYAYYKQATEGPCSEAGSKPAFWDVIGRAKHTAWARLKNMPREEAMQRYVDELHSIVETMSYTDNVATFMQVIGISHTHLFNKTNKQFHLFCFSYIFICILFNFHMNIFKNRKVYVKMYNICLKC